MTYLRGTKRRHLPQPFDKLDNNNYRANPAYLPSDLLFQETRESQFVTRETCQSDNFPTDPRLFARGVRRRDRIAS